MTFTGTFERVVDDKHRVALPKTMRDQFVSTEKQIVYAAPGNDQCVALYTEKRFQEYAEELEKLSSARLDVRNFLRIFYSQAEGVEPDKQGRIRLPDRLISFAHLKSQVVLVGVRDHAEIWEQARWNQLLQTHTGDFDALALSAMGTIDSSSKKS